MHSNIKMLTRPLLTRPRREADARQLTSTFAVENSLTESFIQSETSRQHVKMCIFIEQQYKEESTRRIRLTWTTTLNPDDTLVLSWQLIVLICILIYFLELPIALTFSNSYRDRDDTGHLFQLLNIPSLVVFTINIAVRFRTAYYHKGILINDPKLVAMHYLKYFFVWDFIALASISISQGQQIHDKETSESSEGNVVYPYCLLFFFKIIDLYQIEKSINRSLQLHRRLKAIFNLSILVFFILCLCSAYACIFFMISSNYKEIHMAVKSDDPICWIEAVKVEGILLLNHKWTVQYAYSLYWAATTMLTVGYGDITPKNRYQVVFAIVAEFTSCLVFAYSVNKIWQIKMQLNEKREKYQKKSNVINRYMRDKDVKSQIRSKVNAYLAHFYNEEKLRETELENQVIRELAPGLRQELYMDSYGFIFKQFSVFKPFSEDFFTELVYKIEQVRYSQSEIIYEPGQEEQDFRLGYLFKGKIHTYIKMNTRKYVVSEVSPGDIYGHYQFFTGLSTSTAIRADCYCLVYSLKMSDWKSIIFQFYDDFQKYCEMRDSAAFLNNLRPLRITCSLCDSHKHIAEDCASSALASNKILQIQNYKNSQNSARVKTIHRRKFRDVSILDKNYLNEVKTMREFIINRTEMDGMRSSSSSNIVAQESLMQDEIDDQRLSEHLDHVDEDENQPIIMTYSIRKQQSMKPTVHKIKTYSSEIQKKFSRDNKQSAIYGNQTGLVVQPVPDPLSNIFVDAEQIEIDQKDSYEFYFRTRNIQYIIEHQKRPNNRRESKRITVGMQQDIYNSW